MLKQAVILVGGLGTRLGERTKLLPKPMLEVGGRPFLDYLLDEVSRYPTIGKMLLLAGHRAEQVVECYDGKTRRQAAISVVAEPTQLGTGGALKHAAARLDPQFLLLNGDSFFDFNLWRADRRGMFQTAAASAGCDRQFAFRDHRPVNGAARTNAHPGCADQASFH